VSTGRSWRGSIDLVIKVAAVIAALQAAYIAISGERDPAPFLLAAVGMVAVAEMRLHGFSIRRSLLAVTVGAASAGIWWELFATGGIDRWVTVADAVLCPVVGMAAAWLIRTDDPRRQPADA